MVEVARLGADGYKVIPLWGRPTAGGDDANLVPYGKCPYYYCTRRSLVLYTSYCLWLSSKTIGKESRRVK